VVVYVVGSRVPAENELGHRAHGITTWLVGQGGVEIGPDAQVRQDHGP
jgi:hypothetical protein